MIVIHLGGLTYALRDPSVRAASLWRARLRAELEPLIQLIEQSDRELSDLGDLGAALREFGPAVMGAPETICDLVLAWDQQLERDRDRILDHATDQEMIAALLAILRVAYPFGALAQIGALRPGPGTGAPAPTPQPT